MAVQGIDPFYIDINLVSSTDLQTNVSDYINLIEAFIDEYGANSIYWHTDSHSDTLTSKIKFYEEMNNASLKIKENKDGVYKDKTTGEQLQNKNYRDQLPANYLLKTASGNRYDKATLKSDTEIEAVITTQTRVWKSDSDETTDGNGRWERKTESKDVTYPVAALSEIQKTPVEPQETFGMKDMGPWFILWWMEKFYTSHDIVKRDLQSLLGDQNEYFVNFSESVGQLKNIKDAYDTSTLPVWDINVNAFGDDYSTPTITAGVSKYCLQPESLGLAQQLSNKTNSIFRKNISMILEDPSRDELITGIMPAFSNQSHGNNLVNDFMHPSRMQMFVETVTDVIQEHLKGLYEVLDLLSNRENYMVVSKPKQILLKVEKFTTAVDLFKNKIKTFNVSETTGTVSNYGAPVSFNTSKKNTDRLAIDGVDEVISQ